MKPFSRDDLLELWRSVLPRFYTESIEFDGEGRGFDVPALQAEIFARFERALNTTQQAYFLRPHSAQTGEIARGPLRARGSVLMTRSGSLQSQVTVPAGTLLEAEQLGSFGEVVPLGRYRTLSDVVFGIGAGAPQPVEVEAEYPGYSGNLEFGGQVVRFAAMGRATMRVTAVLTDWMQYTVSESQSLAWDRFVPEHSQRYIRLVQLEEPLVSTPEPRRIISVTTVDGQVRGVRISPSISSADQGKVLQLEIEEWADLGLAVSQPDPIQGGRDDTLGAVGNDRGVGRVSGETDDQYAERLTTLPDTISPAAIERAIGSVLDPLAIEWCLKEVSDPDTLLGVVYDIHPWDFGGLPAVEKPVGSQLIGQGIVWLSQAMQRRFFIVCVSRSQLGDFGFGYDVQTTSLAGAWDAETAWDGYPVGFGSAIARVHSLVDQARAAGVGFQILLDCC